MKKTMTLLSLLAVSAITKAQQPVCTNMDFEDGVFTGWTGMIGDNTLSSQGPLQNPQTGIYSTTVNASLADGQARHTIMTTAGGNDTCGAFPVVYPGGMYSVRLGGTTPNYQGEVLEQTFVVSAADTALDVYYAAVLNDGGHAPADQPYFRIDMFDAAQAPIPAGALYLSAGDTGAGFIQCQSTVYYRPWDTLSVNLSAYVGTAVTLRFTVAGCTQSGHYGYAYVDAHCPSSATTVGMAENILRRIQVKPNPSAGLFTISLPVAMQGESTRYRIVDLAGKTVAAGETGSGNSDLLLDASGWSKGIYFLEIGSGATVFREKLVKAAQ